MLLGRGDQDLVDRRLGAELLAGGETELRVARPAAERDDGLERFAEGLGRRGRHVTVGRRTPCHQLVAPVVEVGTAVPERGRALVRQHVHRHLPALADVTEPPLVGHEHVVVEHLGELEPSVLGLDRARGDAGRVHVDEERGDAAVGAARLAGAGEQHAALRVLGVAGPDLLTVDEPSAVDGLGPARERGEVAAGAGLGEALAPQLLAAQEARHHVGDEFRRTERADRRGEHLDHRPDARVGELPAGDLLADDGAEHRRATEPTDGFGPAVPPEVGLPQRALHQAVLRHLFVERAVAREGRRQLVGVRRRATRSGRWRNVRTSIEVDRSSRRPDQSGGSLTIVMSAAPLSGTRG